MDRRCCFLSLGEGIALFFVATAITSAQVTIVNHGIRVDEAKVNLLFQTSCRVVAEEFHLANEPFGALPVTLVLGDPNEGVIGDELNQTYFIYMKAWDDAQFATSVSRIALQHMVSQERKTRIVMEILRRANQMAPVPYLMLRDTKRGRSSSPR